MYEIAKELDVDARAVIACLQDAGVFVRSASSALNDQDANYVRTKIRATVDPRVPEFLRPTNQQRATDELAAEALSILGPDAAKAIRARDRANTPTRRPRPAVATAGRPVTPAVSRDAREAANVTAWAQHCFDPQERAAWLAAGLGWDDIRLAEQCAAAGLTPDHLHHRVDGTRVGDRVRGGETVGSVVARLRQAGTITQNG